MPSHELSPDTCPFCGWEVCAVTASDPRHKDKPKPGDITMCIQCGSLAAFGRDMRLRRLSRRRLAAAMRDPEVQLMVKAHIDLWGGRQQ